MDGGERPSRHLGAQDRPRLSDVTVTRAGSAARARGTLPLNGPVRMRIHTRGCDGVWSTRRSVVVRDGRLGLNIPVSSGETQLRVLLPFGSRGWHSIPFGTGSDIRAGSEEEEN